MNEAEVLRILRVDWVLPVTCGRRVDLASGCIFTRTASTRTAIVFVWLQLCTGTYMAGCLLDVVVMMVVDLLEPDLRLLVVCLLPRVHLTRFF